MGKHCNCVHLQIAADEPFTQYGTIIKQYQLPDLNWDLAEKGVAWDVQYIRLCSLGFYVALRMSTRTQSDRNLAKDYPQLLSGTPKKATEETKTIQAVDDNCRIYLFCMAVFSTFLTVLTPLMMFNEKTAIYTRLNNEPNDYGSIYKTGTSKKYYYVPYTEEEKEEELTRQKKIVLRTLAFCILMITAGLSPLLI